jgi:hypothetical protein
MKKKSTLIAAMLLASLSIASVASAVPYYYTASSG